MEKPCVNCKVCINVRDYYCYYIVLSSLIPPPVHPSILPSIGVCSLATFSLIGFPACARSLRCQLCIKALIAQHSNTPICFLDFQNKYIVPYFPQTLNSNTTAPLV